jgi:hypothetical protein
MPHISLIDDPHLRRALVLWGVLAVAVCVKTAMLDGENSVYPVFAGGARHWWADKPLYINYHSTEDIDAFRCAPVFAVAITPFYLLPGCLGAIAWGILNIVLLLWALHVFVRDVLPGEWPPQRESVFLILAMFGSIVGIWSGQSNALIMALIILGLAAVRRERWWAAALTLAFPIFMKVWPIAIVLLLIVCWPRQLTLRFLAVCAVLALAPFLTRPPDIVAWQYREWYAALVSPIHERWPGYRDAWTIWEQLAAVLHCEAGKITYRFAYMATQLLAAAGVLGWCLWQRRRVVSTGHLLTLILSMWASWLMLFGPSTEQLTYGVIAPSASWAVLVSFAEKKARWLTVTTWAILTLLPAGDIEKVMLGISSAGKCFLPLGVVLFVAWLVWHERGPASGADGSSCQSTNVTNAS